MAYIPVPKDLSKIKSKVMFNLTKRQLLCFGGGGLIGLPLYMTDEEFSKLELNIDYAALGFPDSIDD